MRSRRSARTLLLLPMGVFLIALLLAGCQAAIRTQVSATSAAADAASAAPAAAATATSVPTATHEAIPPTWTPAVMKAATSVPGAYSQVPTTTATFNAKQTLNAQATNASSTRCEKLEDAWQITVKPSWKVDWCQVYHLGGTYYEYRLKYPESWKVNTFGDIYPNMVLITPYKNVELRLYQVYSVHTKPFLGRVNDALTAEFCEKDDTTKCKSVVDPLETIVKKQFKQIGHQKVLILDSKDGQLNVRRYFFMVSFDKAKPALDRLFFFKLYTPETVTDKNYPELQNRLEYILDSIESDLS